MDTEQLVELELFKDMRCPKCFGRNLTTRGIFKDVTHVCMDCGKECTDEESLRAGREFRERNKE